MAKKDKFEKLKEFYEKNKIELIILLILFIFLCICFELFLFYNEKIEKKDLKFIFLQWSEYCDGKNYTLQEKTDFCNLCFKDGGKNCDWPLDMNFTIDKVKKTISTKGEVHCFLIVDGINYYKEKGSFYGLTEQDLFTWEKLDASKSHKIEFCCGIQRESLITNMFRLEKELNQACIEKSAEPRCVK
jgi:hypothetical protein